MAFFWRESLIAFSSVKGISNFLWHFLVASQWKDASSNDIYFEVLLMSGLKLSRRACLSHKLPPSLGPPSLGLSAGCWGCEFLLENDGPHDSSYAVACLCSLDSLRFILLLHWVVESRRPVLARSYFGLGLEAVGETELIIIVGIGMDWHDESTCCVYKGPESAELVEGLCSVRKLGSSGAAKESRRFFCTLTTFGGTDAESRRELL